jgi:hypothetical protein
LLARPAALTQAIRRHSPISEAARREVAAALTRLVAKPDRQTLQRVATALRGPLERVFQSTSAGTLEIGDWLLSVKHATPHGLFGALFQDSPNSLDAAIPMTVKQGQMFMRVAAHPYIRDHRNWKHLPIGNVSTLDALMRATSGNPATLARLVATGLVHPKMSREAAEKLRTPESWHQPLRADVLEKLRRLLTATLRNPDPEVRTRVLDLLRHVLEQEDAQARHAAAYAEADHSEPVLPRPAPEWTDDDDVDDEETPA